MRSDSLSYYTVKKILSIINSYHVNIENAKDLSREMRSVGVSQYGIESTIPKSNTISNVVEKEAIRQMNMSSFFAEMMTDIKYLQDRWGRITDEQDAIILSMRLSGYSVSVISERVKVSRKTVYLRLEDIARTIGGYPQVYYTDYTD